jgi:pyrroloquinoline quinone biosynthesis protein D
VSTLNPELIPRLAPRTRLQVDQVTGDPVLLYPEGVLVLNETARDIIEKCDGERSVSVVVRLLAEEYDAAEAELMPDVLECLQQLAGKNLLQLQQ